MKKVWVEFIGSGFEVVEMVQVEASSFSDALDKAEEWYKKSGKTFHYCETEVRGFQVHRVLIQRR